MGRADIPESINNITPNISFMNHLSGDFLNGTTYFYMAHSKKSIRIKTWPSPTSSHTRSSFRSIAAFVRPCIVDYANGTLLFTAV